MILPGRRSYQESTRFSTKTVAYSIWSDKTFFFIINLHIKYLFFTFSSPQRVENMGTLTNSYLWCHNIHFLNVEIIHLVGAGSIPLKIPLPPLPAYKRDGFDGSMVIELKLRTLKPLLTGFQCSPPSMLLKIPLPLLLSWKGASEVTA